MKPLIIVPDTQKENIPSGIQGRFSYTYLHGKLQDDCDYDCYNVIGFEEHGFIKKDDYSSIVVDESKYGIYNCVYNNKECTLYLWTRKEGITSYCGIVVYNDDVESVEYALWKYRNKDYNI